jgi:hypothetical protein
MRYKQSAYRAEVVLCKCDDCTARRPKRSVTPGKVDPERWRKVVAAIKKMNEAQKDQYYSPRSDYE